MHIRTFPILLATAALLPASPIAAVARPSSPHAPSDTVRVPSDAPTIQAGLDMAVPGDVVVVAAGIYTARTARTFSFTDPDETLTLEAVGFLPAGITLESEDGAASTSIEVPVFGSDGHSHGLVVAQIAGPEPATVRGFTFRTPGTSEADPRTAFEVRENPDSWSLTVEGCRFEDLSGGLAAGALRSFDGGSLLVRDCEFVNVDNALQRGALEFRRYLLGTTSLEVDRCSFLGCDGGAIRAVGATLRVTECEFESCSTMATVGNNNFGSCIRFGAETTTVEDCTFRDCTNTPLWLTSRAEVRRSTFVECEGPVGGGALLRGTSGLVAECRFERCQGGSAGAVYAGGLYQGAAVDVRGNVFVGIRTELFGAVYANRIGGEVANNTFVDCENMNVNQYASAVWVHPTTLGETTLRHNIFAGGTGGPAVRATSTDNFEESCNDYWNNITDTEGFVPDATSFQADPLFCAPDRDDFTIQSDSPCAPPGVTGCELVGALPVGCGPVAIEGSSWARIKSRYRTGP